MQNADVDTRKKRKLIAIGIGIRLFGVGLIVLGDGHDNLWAKILVVVGVIISVTGISILRYLLLSPLFGKVGATNKTPHL